MSGGVCSGCVCVPVWTPQDGRNPVTPKVLIAHSKEGDAQDLQKAGGQYAQEISRIGAWTRDL